MSPAGLDLGVYEYRDGKWNKIEISGGGGEVGDNNWWYSLKDLENFEVQKWSMDDYGDYKIIGTIDVMDQIVSENKDKHYIIIPKNIYDLGKENNTYTNDLRFDCTFNGKNFGFYTNGNNTLNKSIDSTFDSTGQFVETIYYSPIYTVYISKPFLFMVDNA